MGILYKLLIQGASRESHQKFGCPIIIISAFRMRGILHREYGDVMKTRYEINTVFSECKAFNLGPRNSVANMALLRSQSFDLQMTCGLTSMCPPSRYIITGIPMNADCMGQKVKNFLDQRENCPIPRFYEYYKCTCVLYVSVAMFIDSISHSKFPKSIFKG